MLSTLGQCVLAFVFGSVVGLLVQRSRFCNTAALRDAILFKTYRNTKALLVAMMILTIGFTGFITIGEGNTMQFDVGLNTFAGLFIFGIGMVLAGACTVSTWVKCGEGNFGAFWALLFTFIGMFLFSLVWSVNYWPPAPGSMTGEVNAEALQLGFMNAATLQEELGVPAILFGVVQTLVLLALYRAILRKEARAAAAKTIKRAGKSVPADAAPAFGAPPSGAGASGSTASPTAAPSLASTRNSAD